MTGRVVSVNVSGRKHVAKKPVAQAEMRPDHGVVGDAHAAPGDRQVSLLAVESIERQNRAFSENAAAGETVACPKAGDALGPGAFAENLTTSGLDLPAMPLGTRLSVGEDVVLEISKIGKECHRHCAIYQRLGDCVMPREGVFARVIRGGVVRPNDEVRIEEGGDPDGQ